MGCLRGREELGSSMTYPFLFLLLVGTSYRIYRFLGRDDITEGLRLRLPDRVRNPLSCGWCAGSWTSLAVVVVYDLLYALPLPVLWVLAVSTVVGFLSELDNG